MKNFNQNTKFFFSTSFSWNFQSALFKTKRRCFFDALKVIALYEPVNKVLPLDAAWLGSHSGT